MYLNGQRIDPDKWSEFKVKDQLCFGTPISKNSFRYILEQLTSEDYQLVREESIAEEELLGGTKKKPSAANTCEAGVIVIDNEKEEGTSDKDEVTIGTSITPGDEKRNEMLLSMQEEFLCVICQELFVKAHSLSCSHSYCENCIREWMKKGNKYCPMCRKTIEGKPVPSIAMDNAISKLVECLPEEVQKERTELLKERTSTKAQNKDVIVITDDSPGPSGAVTRIGMVTRSITRRTINVLSDSDSESDSELSNSDSNSDDDSERYDGDEFEEYEAFEFYCTDSDLSGYNGLPGHTWGGYGSCYRCGECLIKPANNIILSCLLHR